MRLIDADAVKEIFRTKCGLASLTVRMLDEIDKLPTIEAEPARQWISVEDKLPEEGKVVLAFGTRSTSTGQFQGVGAKPWFWYWKGTIRRVTHWMPLPEAPKEED